MSSQSSVCVVCPILPWSVSKTPISLSTHFSSLLPPRALVLPQMSSPALSAAHWLHFPQSILRSRWWRCISGKCLLFISCSRYRAGQMLQRPAHQSSVCPGLFDHVRLSLSGRVAVSRGMRLCRLWNDCESSRCCVIWGRSCGWGQLGSRENDSLVLESVQKKGGGGGGRSFLPGSAVFPAGHLSAALCWSERKFGSLILSFDLGNSTFQRIWVSRWILLSLEEQVFKPKSLSTLSLAQWRWHGGLCLFHCLPLPSFSPPPAVQCLKPTWVLVIGAALCHSKCFLCILPHIWFGLRLSPFPQMFTAGPAPPDMCRRAPCPAADQSGPSSSCCPSWVRTFSKKLWSCPEHRVYFY